MEVIKLSGNGYYANEIFFRVSLTLLLLTLNNEMPM